jgi:CP family cyanate transporter-like MFS transporter
MSLRPLLLGVGILAVAFNMRTAISATAPLIETVVDDTGMSSSATGMLTTLPVVCFGLLAPLRQQASPPIVLWREPLAWQVTLFMGLQSFTFFAVMTWLPTIFIDAGMSEGGAGLMLSLTNLFGVFTSFAMPVLAGRSRGQGRLVIAMIVLWATGIGGLLVAPMTGTLLWIACVGLAQGSALGIALSMMVLRSPDAPHAARLSGMAQSVGYSLAALGPYLSGFLHDVTGGWTLALALPLALALMVPLLVVGLGAARDRVLGQPAPITVAA